MELSLKLIGKGRRTRWWMNDMVMLTNSNDGRDNLPAVENKETWRVNEKFLI